MARWRQPKQKDRYSSEMFKKSNLENSTTGTPCIQRATTSQISHIFTLYVWLLGNLNFEYLAFNPRVLSVQFEYRDELYHPNAMYIS